MPDGGGGECPEGRRKSSRQAFQAGERSMQVMLQRYGLFLSYKEKTQLFWPGPNGSQGGVNGQFSLFQISEKNTLSHLPCSLCFRLALSWQRSFFSLMARYALARGQGSTGQRQEWISGPFHLLLLAVKSKKLLLGLTLTDRKCFSYTSFNTSK